MFVYQDNKSSPYNKPVGDSSGRTKACPVIGDVGADRCGSRFSKTGKDSRAWTARAGPHTTAVEARKRLGGLSSLPAGGKGWKRLPRDASCRGRAISRILFPEGGGDHFSGTPLARRLERPTRKSRGAGRSSSAGALSFPIWSFSDRGLPCPPCHHVGGELLPHRFTLACVARATIGGLLSVALSVALRPVDVIHRSALRSPDFPQAASGPRSPRRPARHPISADRPLRCRPSHADHARPGR